MTNASTWFYQPPEPIAYLIAERINSTFWSARIVDVYWTVTHTDLPYRAEGELEGEPIRMEWVPNEWLALAGPGSVERFAGLVNAVSRRVVARKPALTYTNRLGQTVYEWHPHDNAARWSQIQGNPEFIAPKKLSG